MRLNSGQQAAVEACAASIRDRQPVTRLFGFAGTGKTTIVPWIVEASGIDPGRVIYAAPTGKAAAVLTRKLGGYQAKTIHSLLYHPPEKAVHEPGENDAWSRHPMTQCSKGMCGQKPLRKDEFRWTIDDAKAYLASRASLLVIDEASMVGTKLGTDIMSLDIPVLAIGDPAQLQPVNDRQFFMDAAPNYLLTKIERNIGNVLLCAQDIREHGTRAIRGYPEIALGAIGQSSALEFSQIIVGKNKTRDSKNAKMRELLGYSGDVPAVGERIICLRNNYQLGCLNGQQFTIDEIGPGLDGRFTAYMECNCEAEWIMDRCQACRWRRDRLMPVWLKGFDGWAGERELADMPYQIGNSAMMATWGYCITAHKSQGSEWPSVLVVNEAWGKESVNWLYTAVTRAMEEVAIVLPTR